MITCTSVASVVVDLEPVPAEQTLAGSPAAGVTVVAGPPGLEVGVWEHTPGTTTDVEVDEVFLVMSGRATIAVAGGPTIEIGPGDVVTLAAAAQTTWTVLETVRKVYVVATA